RKLAHDGNDLCDAALAAIAAPIALVSHVVKIASRRVRIAGAPSDDAANLVILPNGSEMVSKLIEKGYAQGVFLFGPVERQPGDAFLLVNVVDDEFGIGHEYLLTKIRSNCSRRSNRSSGNIQPTPFCGQGLEILNLWR